MTQIVAQYGTLYGDAGREFAMATLAGLSLTRGPSTVRSNGAGISR